ncbi:hypothetical protein CYLTODRAFT_414860 [Cylindrobasidium torrendii FP15055 ss-10]|uniref:Uncharacterized protein n=1 Tax=Cylindrobasidium torrendii FP15055 ss-10 TaxID=1314674 RepID=A0A0D7AVM5_9AGAR|nr:hypothetical protein CYLTODRAFT_414860 [Cylindrobasidium torrendii FP15055 ss-10]
MHCRIAVLRFLVLFGFSQALRLATLNIRYDSKPDDITVADTVASLGSSFDAPSYGQVKDGAEQPWSTRRIRIAQYLIAQKLSVVCIQEGLIRQVLDLTVLLGDEWAWVGKGRDNGEDGGEFSAIFYNTKDLAIVSNDTYWLSETPLEPSKYHGSGSPRLVTTADFHTLDTNQSFMIMNTHLDDISNEQRMYAASMLVTRARYEASAVGNRPIFLTGDFNSPPVGTDSEAYKITTGQHNPVRVNDYWMSRYTVAHDTQYDFALLDIIGDAPRQFVTNIGGLFIFGGSNKGFETVSYSVGGLIGDDGIHMSDHRPIVVEFKLQ